MSHSLLKTIDREYQHMDERGWDRIFLFFDLHGTVIQPNHEEGNVVLDYYPYAKETLLLLTDKENVDLSIYTCSHEHEIVEYQRLFKEDGIHFKYVNENPDVPTNGYGNYDIKPYMNILFEDKAGFFGETDWFEIYNHFRGIYGLIPIIENMDYEDDRSSEERMITYLIARFGDDYTLMDAMSMDNLMDVCNAHDLTVNKLIEIINVKKYGN